MKEIIHKVPNIPEHIRKYILILCEHADGTAEEKVSYDELLIASCTVTNYFLSGFPGEEIKIVQMPNGICFTETATNDFTK